MKIVCFLLQLWKKFSTLLNPLTDVYLAIDCRYLFINNQLTRIIYPVRDGQLYLQQHNMYC